MHGMSPESAQRAGNEIHRAMNEYVVMPDPPSAEDMLGVPAASTLFELSPGDVVEHYVVAHSDGDLGEFDADSYPPNRGKWVSGEFHAGVVTDPELEASLSGAFRYPPHKRHPTKVVTVVLGQCGRLKYACCVCGGDVYGVHCRHTFSVLQKKLQVITTSGSTFKPHPVSMRLTNACQQAILSGDVSAVQEELAIGYTGRADAIATAAKKNSLRYAWPCPHPCGCLTLCCLRAALPKVARPQPQQLS